MVFVFKDTDIPVKFYLQFVTQIQDKTFFSPSATTCPFSGLRGPPSWAWQERNRLLRLERP